MNKQKKLDKETKEYHLIRVTNPSDSSDSSSLFFSSHNTAKDKCSQITERNSSSKYIFDINNNKLDK